MAKGKKAVEQTQPVVEAAQQPPVPIVNADALTLLAQALQQAIKQGQPPEKKTILTYKGRTPWTPEDGSPKLKLKRKMHIHSLLVDPDMHSNEEIALLNKVKPGRYFDGFVVIERRRDKGLNITWPIKTRDQMMRLAGQYGVTSLVQLLQRCITESLTPKVDDADPVDED